MAKNTLPTKSTGDQLTAAELNEIASAQNTNDDLRAAALTAAQNAQSTADSKLTQVQVDARILGSSSSLSAGDNELTFDVPNETLTYAGGTVSFTLASSGNVDGAEKEIWLDQSTISSLGAEFENDGALTSDNTKLQRVFMRYRNLLGAEKVSYIIKHSPPISDITAPVFTAGPSSQNVDTTTAEATFTINETGDVFAVVVADGADAPTPAEVIAGTGSGGSGQIDTDSVLANTTGTLSFTGLTASTAYDIYLVARDDEGTPNVQASVTKVDITTASAFTDDTSLLSAISTRYETDEAFTFFVANRSFSGWFKGINVVDGTSNWTIMSHTGDTSNNVIRLTGTGDADQITISIAATDGPTQKNVVFTGFSGVDDGNHHHIVVTWDFTNVPGSDNPTLNPTYLKVYLDGVELTKDSETSNPTWNKAEIVNDGTAIFFCGSSASGGDIIDDIVVYNGVLSSGNVTSLYNGGTPTEVRSSQGGILADANIEMYLTFEGDQVVDLMGNHTFTAVAGGATFSTDTPTNPA